MQFLRHNLILIILFVIGGLVFSVYGCPYFHDLHHSGVCVVVYAFLVLAFIYSRTVVVKRRARRNPRAN